jgi:hypothetical protein
MTNRTSFSFDELDTPVPEVSEAKVRKVARDSGFGRRDKVLAPTPKAPVVNRSRKARGTATASLSTKIDVDCLNTLYDIHRAKGWTVAQTIEEAIKHLSDIVMK